MKQGIEKIIRNYLQGLILVLALGIFCCSCIVSESRKNGDRHSSTIKVLTYNVFHGETMKHDFDLDRIAGVILKEDPDFVALQEIDVCTARSKQMDIAAELASRTNLKPFFGKAMEFDGGEYGIAILSKFEVLSTNNIALPSSAGWEPRTALSIKSVLSSGDTILLVNTHLDHHAEDSDRIKQVDKLNAAFGTKDYPTLLVGDLNAEPGSKVMEIIESKWIASYKSGMSVPTFPSDQPVKKIDYILYQPINKWSVVETKVICDAIASDHCAYLAILKLNNI